MRRSIAHQALRIRRREQGACAERSMAQSSKRQHLQTILGSQTFILPLINMAWKILRHHHGGARKSGMMTALRNGISSDVIGVM